jgi:hypothetical protein
VQEEIRQEFPGAEVCRKPANLVTLLRHLYLHTQWTG